MPEFFNGLIIGLLVSVTLYWFFKILNWNPYSDALSSLQSAEKKLEMPFTLLTGTNFEQWVRHIASGEFNKLQRERKAGRKK